MPRNTHPLHGLVMVPANYGNDLRLQAQRTVGESRNTEPTHRTNQRAEMLAGWMREMHFPRGRQPFRRFKKGRIHVRVTFLKPIAADD